MVRGTFANVRLRNELVAPREGGYTVHVPSGTTTTVFDAAERYRAEGTPLVVLAGKSYGQGSSRDWAAKGPRLLGVGAVIAESYERIHRSNLVEMGVLPLTFRPGESWRSLGLTGRETFRLTVPRATGLAPGGEVGVVAERPGSGAREFTTSVRLTSHVEADHYRAGGVLPLVMDRRFAK
jgi:aconitate hydratase